MPPACNPDCSAQSSLDTRHYRRPAQQLPITLPNCHAEPLPEQTRTPGPREPGCTPPRQQDKRTPRIPNQVPHRAPPVIAPDTSARRKPWTSSNAGHMKQRLACPVTAPCSPPGHDHPEPIYPPLCLESDERT